MVSFNTIGKIHKKIMYHDECDVYSYEDVEDEDGAVETQRNVLVYEKVPCKISFSLRTWDMFSKKEIDTTTYEKQPKIFMENKYNIQPGYYLEARRYDDKTGQLLYTYKGQAGLPQVSLSHQEILLNVKGDS